MTDEDLVDLVCKGETRKFEALVQRHQDAVYSMVRRYVVGSGDAEDVAQEIFLRAFRSLASFRREAKFSTWLYRIAYNRCVDWARRNARLRHSQRTLGEDEEIPDQRTDVESTALDEIQRREVRRAASGLDERYRSVVMMYYFDGRSYDEIGGILGIPTKTVETRLYRARRQMRRILTTRGGAG